MIPSNKKAIVRRGFKTYNKKTSDKKLTHCNFEKYTTRVEIKLDSDLKDLDFTFLDTLDAFLKEHLTIAQNYLRSISAVYRFAEKQSTHHPAIMKALEYAKCETVYFFVSWSADIKKNAASELLIGAYKRYRAMQIDLLEFCNDEREQDKKFLQELLQFFVNVQPSEDAVWDLLTRSLCVPHLIPIVRSVVENNRKAQQSLKDKDEERTTSTIGSVKPKLTSQLSREIADKAKELLGGWNYREISTIRTFTTDEQCRRLVMYYLRTKGAKEQMEIQEEFGSFNNPDLEEWTECVDDDDEIKEIITLRQRVKTLPSFNLRFMAPVERHDTQEELIKRRFDQIPESRLGTLQVKPRKESAGSQGSSHFQRDETEKPLEESNLFSLLKISKTTPVDKNVLNEDYGDDMEEALTKEEKASTNPGAMGFYASNLSVVTRPHSKSDGFVLTFGQSLKVHTQKTLPREDEGDDLERDIILEDEQPMASFGCEGAMSNNIVPKPNGYLLVRGPRFQQKFETVI